MKTEIKAKAPVARVPSTPAIQRVAYHSDIEVAAKQGGSYNYISPGIAVNSNLIALDTAIANIPAQTDYTLTIGTPESPDTSYAAQYEFKQCGSTIATINIPKDMVVSSGSVVDITFNTSDSKLYDGATDVTEKIKGTGGTATSADAGKYVKLVIANASDDTLYISAKDLVDEYTGSGSGTNAAQVKVEITNNVISAHIVEGSIGTTELDSTVNAALTAAGSALQASDIAEGTTNGTIAVKGTDVAVHGLGSAAYTASTAYATAAQGDKADSALQKADITEGATNGTISVGGTDVAVHGLGTAAYTAASDYATAAQGALAESAVQSVAVASGTNDGTIKLTVNGTTTDNIAVTGLNTAAFSSAASFATSAQGALADTAIQPADLAGKVALAAADDTTIEVSNSTLQVKAGGIGTTQLASGVVTSLGKADTAVQNVTLASGTNNGTVKLTVDGTATDNIAVTGLGSAAYTASTDYATAAQGTKADSAVQSVTGDSGVTISTSDHAVTVAAKVDGSTVEVDSTSKNIQVKDGGITTDKLAVLTSFQIKDTATSGNYANQIYTITIDNGVLTITPAGTGA